MAERKTKAATGEGGQDPKAAAEGGQEPTAAAKSRTAAAPLEAPTQKAAEQQQAPPLLPPNAVAPHAPHEASSVTLYDESGNEISVDDVLAYPAADDPSKLATVTQRFYKEYVRRGTKTKIRELGYAAGARIPLTEARRLKDEVNPPQPSGEG